MIFIKILVSGHYRPVIFLISNKIKWREIGDVGMQSYEKGTSGLIEDIHICNKPVMINP